MCVCVCVWTWSLVRMIWSWSQTQNWLYFICSEEVFRLQRARWNNPSLPLAELKPKRFHQWCWWWWGWCRHIQCFQKRFHQWCWGWWGWCRHIQCFQKRFHQWCWGWWGWCRHIQCFQKRFHQWCWGWWGWCRHIQCFQKSMLQQHVQYTWTNFGVLREGSFNASQERVLDKRAFQLKHEPWSFAFVSLFTPLRCTGIWEWRQTPSRASPHGAQFLHLHPHSHGGIRAGHRAHPLCHLACAVPWTQVGAGWLQGRVLRHPVQSASEGDAQDQSGGDTDERCL